MMKINEVVPTADPHYFSGRDTRNQRDIRTVQTNLTNQQLADLGLVICEPSRQNSISHRFLGIDANLRATHPTLTQFSSFEGLLRKPAGLAEQAPDWIAHFAERLNVLDQAAIEDEIIISKKSRTEANDFAASLHGARMPTVFLVGNGNVRLRWSNKQGEKVGLQFRGNGEVQYLFFKRVGDKMEQMLGTKLVSTIESFIATCGLRHVIAG